MCAESTSGPKRERLGALSTQDGIIAALAMDQRKSLRRLMADVGGVSIDQVPDERLVTFKSAVAELLTPHASAILLDPEYGADAASHRAHGSGLLLAYELDGYDNPRPNRMLALMPRLSVRRLRDMGADGIKILLHYAPDDAPEVNEEKCALIERIGNECAALDMPFFFEPIVYESVPVRTQGNTKDAERQALEVAQRKPKLVIATMREFSRSEYKIDVLKVEFPVVAKFVEGSRTNRGPFAYTMDEALAWYRAADQTAGCPYIYLSAGVPTPEFQESLRLAGEAHTRFSGVLCGRATWQDAIPVFMREGDDALRHWLESTGADNLHMLNRLLERAVPWASFVPGGHV
jgi:tagatose 1,6-diphosphate aldolase